MKFLSAEQRGSLYVISSGVCYGFIGYFGVTLINSDLSLANMLFWRFFIAALFIFPILVTQLYKDIRVSLKENLKIVLYGMLFYSTSSITYFVGSKYIGTGLTMVVFFTYPALVMLFNCVLYKAKINISYYLAFSMMIFGIILLVDLHDLEFGFLGIGFGVLSATCYACYIIASKKSNVAPIVSTFMLLIGCTVTCLIFTCLEYSFFVPHLDSWINIIPMAIICTALPIILVLQGLKYISSEKASIVSILEPIFVLMSGIILLGERVSNIQILGIVAVLSGALITLFAKNMINQK